MTFDQPHDPHAFHPGLINDCRDASCRTFQRGYKKGLSQALAVLDWLIAFDWLTEHENHTLHFGRDHGGGAHIRCASPDGGYIPVAIPTRPAPATEPRTKAGQALLAHLPNDALMYQDGDGKMGATLDDLLAIEAEARSIPLDRARLLRAIERTPGFGRDMDYASRLASEYERLEST